LSASSAPSAERSASTDLTYALDRMEPTIATPTDAPANRLTKLRDDPSPAFDSGRLFITTVEGGAISTDVPTPSRTDPTSIFQSGPVPVPARTADARATTTNPVVIVALAPNRRTARCACSEQNPKTAANGRNSIPTTTICSPRTSRRYCGFKNRKEFRSR
jgi:hypothetical protein